jgi:flagellar protein FlbD
MITLHRLGHTDEPFMLNDDLIVTVEACPDTVVSLATGSKIVVAETPEQVADSVREWRASVRLASLRSV